MDFLQLLPKKVFAIALFLLIKYNAEQITSNDVFPANEHWKKISCQRVKGLVNKIYVRFIDVSDQRVP